MQRRAFPPCVLPARFRRPIRSRLARRHRCTRRPRRLHMRRPRRGRPARLRSSAPLRSRCRIRARLRMSQRRPPWCNLLSRTPSRRRSKPTMPLVQRRCLIQPRRPLPSMPRLPRCSTPQLRPSPSIPRPQRSLTQHRRPPRPFIPRPRRCRTRHHRRLLLPSILRPPQRRTPCLRSRRGLRSLHRTWRHLLHHTRRRLRIRESVRGNREGGRRYGRRRGGFRQRGSPQSHRGFRAAPRRVWWSRDQFRPATRSAAARCARPRRVPAAAGYSCSALLRSTCGL